MGVGNLPNPPTPGQPVASAWGNAVSVRVIQAYASKAQLDLVWNDAPEGAYAVTTDTMRLFQRRGGVWAVPLSGPLGNVVGPIVNDGATDVSTNSGIWYSETPMGPYNLLINRLYQVQWSVRWENRNIAATPAIIGGDLAAAGTGDDAAIEGGFGQQALVYGYTLNGVGAATRQTTAGTFHTKGTGAPNTTVPVTIAHRYIGTTGTWNVSRRNLVVYDVGPWPGTPVT